MTDDDKSGLIEYLPGMWLTPYQCRAMFCGGPILDIKQTLELAAMFESTAARLLAQASQLRQMADISMPKDDQ